MPRFLSADAAMLAAQYLVGSLWKPTPNALFAIINDTHHATLIILKELSTIIPKAPEQQSTNRYNGRRTKRQEVDAEPDQMASPVTHQYPEIQHKHQTPTPSVQSQKRKSGRPPRVDQSENPMVTQEKINLEDL